MPGRGQAPTGPATLSFDDFAYPQLDVARIWPASDGVDYRQRVVMTTATLLAFSTAIYDDVSRRSWPAASPAQ
jgi:hypothetical protein